MIDFSIHAAGYSGRPVLEGVNGSVRAGEFTVILGMNGGGKSTFLRCLAGLHKEMEGEVRVGGSPLPGLSARDRARNIAFLSQSSQPAFAFQGREVIALARYASGHGGAPSPDDLDRVTAQFEVEAFLSRRVDSLSGGEWQRIALARTFYQGSGALLLDEPTAHLDLGHRLATFRFCRQVASEGKAVLAATHDLESAFEFADRLIFLKGGKIVADGAPMEVVTAGRVEEVFGQAPIDIRPNPFSCRPQLVVRETEEGGRR